MKLLLIQLRRLGDALMTTPSVAAIKRARPQAEIHFLIQEGCAGIVRGNPDVDAVIPADSQGFFGLARRLRREHYDTVVDFQGLPKTALLAKLTGARQRVGFARRFRSLFYTHAVSHAKSPEYSAIGKARLLVPLGIPVSGFTLRLPVGPGHDAEARAVSVALDLDAAGRVAAFSPVSRREYKRWPLSRFAAVCDALYKRRGWRFLPLFGPDEAWAVDEVITQSRCREAFLYPYPVPSFNALFPLLKKCAFYFGNDNGIRHAAIAAGLPTAAVFGTPDPRAWTPPDDPRHVWLWGKAEMEKIGVADFITLIEKLLDENKIV